MPKAETSLEAGVKIGPLLRGDEASVFWSWADQNCLANLILQEESPKHAPGTFDLMERTAQSGEAVIRFAKRIPMNAVNDRLINQLVGAGTSIGANFCGADDAVSGKDFKNKIGTCRKESKETMFFLWMIATSEETLKEEARKLWSEAKELNLIFGAIWRKPPNA